MPRTGRPKSGNPKVGQLKIQIEPNIKDAFYERCKESNIVPAKLLRKWILEFLENKKK